MRIFDTYDEPEKPTRVRIRATSGYLITVGSPRLALYCAVPQNVELEADSIEAIDVGLTLDEAYSNLTASLTKAELVVLGDGIGLSLSETSLKAELLATIYEHLEGMA